MFSLILEDMEAPILMGINNHHINNNSIKLLLMKKKLQSRFTPLQVAKATSPWEEVSMMPQKTFTDPEKNSTINKLILQELLPH